MTDMPLAAPVEEVSSRMRLEGPEEEALPGPAVEIVDAPLAGACADGCVSHGTGFLFSCSVLRRGSGLRAESIFVSSRIADVGDLRRGGERESSELGRIPTHPGSFRKSGSGLPTSEGQQLVNRHGSSQRACLNHARRN